MVLDVVQVRFYFLVLCQTPLPVHNIFVVVGAWLQLQRYLPVLLNLVEVQLVWLLPIVPRPAYHHLLWTRNLLSLETK